MKKKNINKILTYILKYLMLWMMSYNLLLKDMNHEFLFATYFIKLVSGSFIHLLLRNGVMANILYYKIKIISYYYQIQSSNYS